MEEKLSNVDTLFIVSMILDVSKICRVSQKTLGKKGVSCSIDSYSIVPTIINKASAFAPVRSLTLKGIFRQAEKRQEETGEQGRAQKRSGRPVVAIHYFHGSVTCS